MTKFIRVIIAVVLLFSFSGKAYCWSLNDIKNTVQQAASGTTNNMPTSTSNNNTTQQQAVQQQAVTQPSQPEQPQAVALSKQMTIPDYIKVDKGSYGLPLGATMDAFLAWCKEKNVSIAEQTADEFKEDLKRMVRGAKMDEDLTGDALEKEVDARLANKDLDDAEKIGPAQIKERINILNGPSFTYLDKRYLMAPLFLDLESQTNGISYPVPGEEKPRVCSSGGVVKNTYAVPLTPSQEMKDGGISSMMVFFFQKDQQLKTYAVITGYFYPDSAKQQNQWELIADTLGKKYRSQIKTDNNGTVTKRAFTDAGLIADMVWDELIKNAYIDSNGAIQTKFNGLKNYSDMDLSKTFDNQKEQIYAILQQAHNFASIGITTVQVGWEDETTKAIRDSLDQDAYYLFGTGSSQTIEGQMYYMFGRNVILTGKNDPGRGIDWSSPYYVLYGEPDLEKEVLQIRTNALQSCRNAAIAEKEQQTKSSANNI